ncbi:MAG: putative inorganic carbon transporter subunit DabA [Oligoflexales bacterium]
MFRDSMVQEVSEDNWKYESTYSATLPEKSLKEMIDEASKVLMPSWPLQNAVAVNPFWNFKNKNFAESLTTLEQSIGCKLFLPISNYLEKISEGNLELKDLTKVLRDRRIDGGNAQIFLENAKAFSQSEGPNAYPSIIEFFFNKEVDELVRNDLCKHLMAYFDERQALVSASEKKHSFWNFWFETQEYDHAMYHMGFRKFKDSLNELKSLSHEQAIAHILTHFGFKSSKHKVLYMQTLIGKVLGWGSQFAYQAWQKSLGYAGNPSGKTEELLAVCLAYEYGLAKSQQKSSISYVELFNTDIGFQNLWINKARNVLQESWERSIQKRTVRKLNTKKPKSQKPWCSMVFCIDVRSEMIRRTIENHIPGVSTKGFAGFFGLPTDFKVPNKREASHHLPVLLPAAYQVKVKEEQDSQLTLARSFIKHVRKLPYSSFFYVEVFGLLSAWQLLRDSFAKFFQRLNLRNTIENEIVDKDLEIKSVTGEDLDKSDIANRCTTILKHMGLTKDFPDFVLLVGHTSKASNNAFQSSLTCGACGGHGGELNARVLAHMLNDTDTRSKLAANGIKIPPNTKFLAAIHETVSDRILLFPYGHLEAKQVSKLKALELDLANASIAATAERDVSRSTEKRLTTESTRPFNWSEVRPEWGLAGNHSFIVAPRWRTQGQDHASRAFLNDYDWKQDQDFASLELIMTAPMIVTNWINMQYYASVVAPKKYGSGSKTIHNIFGETGVLQGNGGDLQIGLPLESIHDGKNFIHDPLRLSVYIEAPQKAIENIIAKHETVRELIDNKWLYIVRIDSESGECFLRQGKTNYESLVNKGH